MGRVDYLAMRTQQAETEDLISSDIDELRVAAKRLIAHATRLGGLGLGTSFLKWLASFAAMWVQVPPLHRYRIIFMVLIDNVLQTYIWSEFIIQLNDVSNLSAYMCNGVVFKVLLWCIRIGRSYGHFPTADTCWYWIERTGGRTCWHRSWYRIYSSVYRRPYFIS